MLIWSCLDSKTMRLANFSNEISMSSSPSLETKRNNPKALLRKTKRLATPLPLNNRKSGPKWRDSLVRRVLRLCCSPPWDNYTLYTFTEFQILDLSTSISDTVNRNGSSISGFGVDTAALAAERTERGAIKNPDNPYSIAHQRLVDHTYCTKNTKLYLSCNNIISHIPSF